MFDSSRTEQILGKEAVQKLKTKKIILFGLGGVGGQAAEALCRSGIGSMTLVDGDIVSESNLNRQIAALHSTIGKKKADVLKDRFRDINPDAEFVSLPLFYDEKTADLDLSAFDYVIDAIDTVSSKLLLIEKAKKAGVPVISCMGAGNKRNPALFRIMDIYQTTVCPLARVMRRELRARGIDTLKVVFSEEEPSKIPGGRNEKGKATPGSLPYVPPAAGLVLAAAVIEDLL